VRIAGLTAVAAIMIAATVASMSLKLLVSKEQGRCRYAVLVN
jgi:hypothetical protein